MWSRLLTLDSCGCCNLASRCNVVSYTHTSITCTIDAGQGTNLEVVVMAASQASSGSGVTFAYEPPTITSVAPMSNGRQQSRMLANSEFFSPTAGGDLYRMNGTSFGTSDATIELVGDGKTTGQLSKTLGPFTVVSQDHNSVVFKIPDGQGQGRHFKLNVGSQSNTFMSTTFSYVQPTLDRIDQPASCTTMTRTTSCGSPTIGGFKFTVHGTNFGPAYSTTETKMTVGGIECCNSCLIAVGEETACACCVESRDHSSITAIAPAFNSNGEYLESSRRVPIVLDYQYQNWKYKSHISYDPPWINYINPQTGNAQGQKISVHGINFGHLSGENVEKIRIGNFTCNNTRWTGTSAEDEVMSCYLPMDRVGPKTVEMTVAGQKSVWKASEWSSLAGKRVYSTECPPNFFGRDSEYCFECPFATNDEGVPLRDVRGYKEYLGTCLGGNSEPVANQGFYQMYVRKECGNTGTQCSNATDCLPYAGYTTTSDGTGAIDPGMCSITHAQGAEYCNLTMLETRDRCSYILACDPPEACKANNLCSIVGEGVRDPVTNEEIRPHGYSNTTAAGVPVQRCNACAPGYFRVGGLCEECPKNVMTIAIVFCCGIIGACIVGYVMNRFKVNLAIAAIGIDYAQILSMFLKSQIPWPSQLRTLFRILSSFNFDLDIASPECLVAGLYRFDIKWYCIMAMPICVACVFLCSHFTILCKKRFCQGRTKKLNKHAHAMVSMNLVMMYFLYLYVTRSALDVFNCTPLDPPDPVHPEYTYMSAVGGERCYKEGGLQLQLIPFAVIGIIVYTVGYPLLLAFLFWKNKSRIQRDQYLRAGGQGVVRDTTDSFHIYNIRKRYSHLYYQFKPRSYYWTVVIIARKFSVAFINLMLRQNIEYMLASSLLVMFVAFTFQVHVQPYMGPAEFKNVRKKWGERTKHVSSGNLSVYHTDKSLSSMADRDVLYPEKQRQTTTLENLKRGSGKACKYFVNYNVVEAVLLACSVLIMLAGIMFSSDRFENNKNRDELMSITWVTLAIIVASLAYYSLVLLLEVSAQTCPTFCKKR